MGINTSLFNVPFERKQTQKVNNKAQSLFIEQISQMLLEQFAKRNMALEIYSEILGCELWLCSNEKMANQIKNDDPNAIIYTVDEIMNLIKLKPNPEELRRIHDVKEGFKNSKIIESNSTGKEGNEHKRFE